MDIDQLIEQDIYGAGWIISDDFHEGDYGDDESWLPHATEDELPGIYGGNGYSIIRDEEL